jgi:hypothetical protein
MVQFESYFQRKSLIQPLQILKKLFNIFFEGFIVLKLFHCQTDALKGDTYPIISPNVPVNLSQQCKVFDPVTDD